MVRVSFRYTPELVNWIKQAGPGSRWNPAEKVWDVPDSILEELRFKADELGVELNVIGKETAPTAATVGSTQDEKLGYMEWERPATRPSTVAVQAREGDIRLRRSKDGRFVIISMTLIANTQEIEQLLSGSRTSVRFRILPPRPPQQNKVP